MTKGLVNKFALLGLPIALFAVSSIHAQTLTFDVDINTAALSADSGNAPFYLDFAMLYGNSALASNTATLSNFVLTGGSAVGSAVVASGTASGSLTSTIALTASGTHTDSELYQQFSAGTTNITFQETVTETGPDVGTPTEFTAAILDSSLGSPAQIYTTAPDTESLITLNLSSSNTIANVNGYSSISSADGNTPINGVTAAISPIPEPTTTAAILGCAVAMFVLYTRRFAGRLAV